MLSSILAFTAAALVIVLMPGADTVLVLRTSLRSGARAGISTALGVVCGPVIWGSLAGAGVAFFLSRNPVVYTTVATAGGLYLIYLAYGTFRSAIGTWRSSARNGNDTPMSLAASSAGSRSNFTRGLMTNLLNPKIGVFYLAIMPGLFSRQEVTPWFGAFLGMIHGTLGLAFLIGVATFTGAVRRYITRPKASAVIDLVGGLCLLGFGAYALVDGLSRLI